ncbi:MAG: oligosaccharide flippase family protein [Bacteroidota bacterium]
MQKKFVANLFFLLLLNLTIKPFWILQIDRSVQNILGTEEYGHYFALMNFSFLLNIILDAGLTNYNNRNISRYQFLVKKHFSSLFTLKLMLGGLYFIVAGISAFFLGYHKQSWDLLILLLLNQFFVYLVLYLRSNLAGLQLFKYDSVVSVLDRLLMIIFCGALILTNDKYHLLNIKTFVITQVISYAVVAVVAMLIIFKKVGKVKFTFKPTFSRIIIKKSLPYAILVLLMTFYNRTDSVMLERMLPAGVGALQSGIYAHGYRLLDSANMIAVLFSTLLLPMFSGMLKRNESIQPLVETSFKILMSGVIMIAVLCFCFAEPIMGILYSDEVKESAWVFQWLILSLIPISITYIFGTLLTANGNLKWLNRMALVGVALNITMNFFLIPKLMAFGTAISSLITQAVTAAVQVFLAVKLVKFQIGRTLILKTIFFSAGVFIIAKALIWAPVDLFIWYRFILAGVMGLVLALVLGLLNPGSALAILKNKGAA